MCDPEATSKDHLIEVMLLGSGWAAIQTAAYSDMGWNRDIVTTGFGRYGNRAAAEREAMAWSKAFGIPFKP